jgi:hypothetical protein
MPPPKCFKREKRIDFACVDAGETWCRIDFVLGLPTTGYAFLEIDEHQHRFGYDAMLSCDMKRMGRVMESLMQEAGNFMPSVFWIRYNPHEWHVDGVLKSFPKAERELWLCNFVSELAPHQPLTMGYAFYDSSDDTLDVLKNDQFHAHYAEIALDLTNQRKD